MDRKKRNVTETEIEFINEKVKEGMGLTEIAERLGRSRNGIRRHVRWDDVPVREDIRMEDILEKVFKRLDRVGPRNYRETCVKDIARAYRIPKSMAVELYNRWRMEYLDGNRKDVKF